MSDPVSSAEAIFLAMADLTAEQRDDYLEEHCGHDARLRAEVAAMLAAVDDPDESFLDPARVPALDMAAVDGPLQPGTVLGHYLGASRVSTSTRRFRQHTGSSSAPSRT